MSLASFWVPDYLPISAWVQHGPFAFWLTERLEPRRIVELGTHHGYSFFAFCQAIKQLGLGTSAYAVDTWSGDEHAGYYGGDVFAAVSAEQARYSGCATLVRSTFDDALTYFDDASIDLLHIDGQHHYDDVKHDYESWLPKLTDDAVVLFHDTNVRERQFGTWKFFGELRKTHPSFEFHHGNGLGVLCPGSRVPDALRGLIDCDPAVADETRLAYAALGAAVDNIQKTKLLRGGLAELRRPGADLSRDSLAALAIASGDDIAVFHLGTTIDSARQAAVQSAAQATDFAAERDALLAALNAERDARTEAAVQSAAQAADFAAERDALLAALNAERDALLAALNAERDARTEAAVQSAAQAADFAAERDALLAALNAERDARTEAAVQSAAQAVDFAAERDALLAALNAERDARTEAAVQSAAQAVDFAAERDALLAALNAERDARTEAAVQSVAQAVDFAAERDALLAALNAERDARTEDALADHRTREESALLDLAESEARLAAETHNLVTARAEILVHVTMIDLLRACLRGRDRALNRTETGDVQAQHDLAAATRQEAGDLTAEIEQLRHFSERDHDLLRRWGSAGWMRAHVLSDALAHEKAASRDVDAGLEALRHSRLWRILSRMRPGLRLPVRAGDAGQDPSLVDPDAAAVVDTGLFDSAYYLAENPDLAAESVDPARHFAQSGWKEGRRPHPHFDPEYYLGQRTDVAEQGDNPLLHYTRYGILEGQLTEAEDSWNEKPAIDEGTLDAETAKIRATGLFDEDYYRSAYPDVAAATDDLARHYAEAGWREGRDPSAAFDTRSYLDRYPDVAAVEVNPLLHFVEVGAAEGRTPLPPTALAGLSDQDLRGLREVEDSGLFDADFYASAYPDIAASGMDPTLHYARDGWREGRRPSALFDSASYLKLNPDVAEAGDDPLRHFAYHGAVEGRSVVDLAAYREGDAMSPAARERADLYRKAMFTAEANRDLEAFLRSNERIIFPVVGKPDISVLVVLWNQAHLTLRCLQALAKQRGPSLEIILVDNGSTDQTKSLLKRIDGIKVLRNSDNAGFLLACNRGAAIAEGQALLLLNSDAFVRYGALAAALATLRSSPDIGAVGGRLILPSGRLQEAGSIVWSDSSTLGYGRNLSPDAGEAMFRRDVDYCSGAFLLTPLAVWKRLDGFDPAYVPAYYEEADYCMRLWENGLRVVYEPRATIDHFEFGSEKKRLDTLKLSRVNRKTFRQRHALTLSRHHLPPSESNIVPARTRAPQGQRRLLIIDNEVPYRWLGSGYPRAREIVQEAAADGWFVTFYPLHQPKVDWAAVRDELSVDVEIASGWGSGRLAEFLEERRGLYQTMIVSRPDNMALVKTIIGAKPYLVSDMRIIYDAEALFSVRDALLAEWNGSPVSKEEAERLITSEIALARDVDAVVCVSPPEAEIFRKRVKVPVFVLNHPTICGTDAPGFAERDGFLFVGRLLERGSPNWEGLAWFVAKCWPLIRARLPSVTLRVAGALNVNHAPLQAPGVELLGRVDDLEAIYAVSRVFLAPVHFAAGIPIKVLEASAAGLPIVATNLMARQLSWTPGEDLSVADDAASFAERAVELHEDTDIWQRFVTASRKRIMVEYSAVEFRRILAHILNIGT